MDDDLIHSKAWLAISKPSFDHHALMNHEIAIDKAKKIVSTPCYMLDSRVDEVATGIDKLVQALLALM